MTPNVRQPSVRARRLRDLALWPVLGLVVFWVGYAIAVSTASPHSYYCVQTIARIQWVAIGYAPVPLVGSVVLTRRYPWPRRLLIVGWNVGVTVALVLASFLAAFGGAGPDNCANT